MELRTIKNANEAKLKGITIEVERRDGQFYAVTLRDEAGGFLRIAKNDYSSVSVYVPQEPKEVTKFRVQGEIAGVKVDEVVADKYAGERRADELKEASSIADVKVVETKETEIPF